MRKAIRPSRGARHAGAVVVALAAGGGLSLATGTSASASTTVAAVVCPAGPLTWTFSSPLTLGFTAAGTVTQTWPEPSECVFAEAEPQLNAYPFDGSEQGAASYSGSCVVANAGISSFGAVGETGLLLGGTVLVSPPTMDQFGDENTEVDVLAPNSVCNESSATGVGNDVSTFIVTN